ncbi:hypothetical protein R6Q57_006125 [Mikania cordata]
MENEILDLLRDCIVTFVKIVNIYFLLSKEWRTLQAIMEETGVMNLHIAKPSKRRAHGKNLNLYDKFQKNRSRQFDYSSNLYRAVVENYQLFIRFISNEVDRHAPFHYRSWQEVSRDVKMSILTALHVKEGGVAQHVEGWREMHFKGSSGGTIN